MIDFSKFGCFVFAASALSAALLWSNPANAADCPQIPAVEWWGDTSVEKLSAYVERKHHGDWAIYIDKWERHKEKMRDTMYRGKSAAIKSHNIILEGEELANYIQIVRRRIDAMRCFANDITEARLIDGLNNMETAAGGTPEQHVDAKNDGDCPKFARVEWWNASHEKIITYVSRRHDGDWDPYLEKWGNQLEKMKSLYERGGSAIFKSKNVRLQGEELLKYIEALEGRLSVTKCLAQREMRKALQKKIGQAGNG